MVEVMRNIVSRAKNTKFPGIVPELSDDDIVNIWDTVAGYIERQMNQQKGVQVPGLGTFTLAQQRIDVGNSKYLLIQRPVFQVSEKFSQTHQLSAPKYHLTGHVSVSPLNYAALSVETPFTRDTVESCVREVLQALGQAVAAQKNVEFTFSGIGKLSIRSGKVKMKFYKEFINSMDGSGELVGAMQGRPGTVDSVMTDRAPSRAISQNTFTLPRIQPGHGLANNMGTIDEECGEKEGEASSEDRRPDAIDTLHAEMEMCIDGQEHGREDVAMEASPANGRAALPLAHASLSFLDDIEGSRAPSKMASFTHRDNLHESVMIHNHSDSNHNALPSLPGSAPVERLLPSPPGPQLKKPSPPPRRPHTSGSECGHASAGQELCYLCHQRAKRNVPVSFNEERKKREAEEERLLMEYRKMKDSEATLAEQEARFAKRHDLQKAAAFNLGVAEATSMQKRARDERFHPSYIFQKRPLTPPRFYKQEKYNKDLEVQVKTREEREEKEKSDDAFLQRLEQVQLAEDIAAQRDMMAKQRAEQRDMYQRALDQQVMMKPLPIPARVPHGTEPMIPGEDMAPDRQIVRRRIAHQLFQEQKETVEARKRAELLRRIQEQTEDTKMLEKSKQELISDRVHEYERRMARRRCLENDWSTMLAQKRLREVEDKQRHKEVDELYHEQCDKYHRCGQCQRRINNCGETNLWKESYYVPGARIIL